MEKSTQQKQTYVCDICGATSDQPQTCCGQPMKKDKNNATLNRTEGFYKKKSKGTEVSRFINEGNPNDQNVENQG